MPITILNLELHQLERDIDPIHACQDNGNWQGFGIAQGCDKLPFELAPSESRMLRVVYNVKLLSRLSTSGGVHQLVVSTSWGPYVIPIVVEIPPDLMPMFHSLAPRNFVDNISRTILVLIAVGGIISISFLINSELVCNSEEADHHNNVKSIVKENFEEKYQTKKNAKKKRLQVEDKNISCNKKLQKRCQTKSQTKKCEKMGKNVSVNGKNIPKKHLNSLGKKKTIPNVCNKKNSFKTLKQKSNSEANNINDQKKKEKRKKYRGSQYHKEISRSTPSKIRCEKNKKTK